MSKVLSDKTSKTFPKGSQKVGSSTSGIMGSGGFGKGFGGKSVQKTSTVEHGKNKVNHTSSAHIPTGKMHALDITSC